MGCEPPSPLPLEERSEKLRAGLFCLHVTFVIGIIVSAAACVTVAWDGHKQGKATLFTSDHDPWENFFVMPPLAEVAEMQLGHVNAGSLNLGGFRGGIQGVQHVSNNEPALQYHESDFDVGTMCFYSIFAGLELIVFKVVKLGDLYFQLAEPLLYECKFAISDMLMSTWYDAHKFLDERPMFTFALQQFVQFLIFSYLPAALLQPLTSFTEDANFPDLVFLNFQDKWWTAVIILGTFTIVGAFVFRICASYCCDDSSGSIMGRFAVGVMVFDVFAIIITIMFIVTNIGFSCIFGFDLSVVFKFSFTYGLSTWAAVFQQCLFWNTIVEFVVVAMAFQIKWLRRKQAKQDQKKHEDIIAAKGKPTHVDQLLCFRCFDVLSPDVLERLGFTVSSDGSGPPHSYLFPPQDEDFETYPGVCQHCGMSGGAAMYKPSTVIGAHI